MIQRIQTVYLFIAAVLMGLMHFMPVATINIGGQEADLMAYGVRIVGGSATEMITYFPYLGILASLGSLLALVIIFLYKNRMIQIRLGFAEMVLLVGAQVMAVVYILRYESLGTTIYGIAALFPIISAILAYLAVRAIMKDEAKVRSLDRIR